MTDPLFEVEHQGKTYAMTPQTLIEELIFANYRFNRKRNPEITPAQWRQTIPSFTSAMEQRYQAEVEKGQ